MLEQVLKELKNWFLLPGGIHEGTYTIRDGGIVLPFLQDKQYFRICGSVFNDGLHQYPTEGLTGETFTGTVWALAIPKTVISLADEIEAWQKKNGEIVTSPYVSESFGGYSYTKASGGQSGGAAFGGWQAAFGPRLNACRKIREV